MKDGRKLLPPGWQMRIIIITGAALAGNLLVRFIPWTGSSMAAYETAMKPAAAQGIGFLAATLVTAPLVEELVFRGGIFGWIRRYTGFWAAALISSLAFGMYHGNLIQGVYAFAIGIILSRGYETSMYHKYIMVVLMHGAANLAALAVFGL